MSEQRWQLPAAVTLSDELRGLGLPDPLLALLLRRGHHSKAAIETLLDPPAAPDPHRHFRQLRAAVQRLRQACRDAEAVAICGDYDADGMTSTALLVGLLRRLGARPVAAIPSRQDDGYGLNSAMVERLEAEGIRLLVTVDNGVAAREALERAAALGVEVVNTDHHTLPPELPPCLALLHPACTPADSPYRGLAGVGLATVLAQALARSCRATAEQALALDLFCIGTIADMAPLLGVNRRWLIDGLPHLRRSSLVGLQALQQVAGLDDGAIDATAVGFQIAPASMRWVGSEIRAWWWSCSPPMTANRPLNWRASAKRSTASAASSAMRSKRRRGRWSKRTESSEARSCCSPRATGTTA